jgi:uncharacterized protein
MESIDLLVIQPTPFCNINCSYCYLPDRDNPKKISIAIIESIINSLVTDKLLSNQLSIVWHAGEPLVLAPSFYKPFFQLIQSKLSPLGISIHHSIQTNGTLITQEWCDFIKEYQIRIGISIDGPKEVQDANRKTRNGKGTFENVLNGIQLLQLNNIDYHGIAVVSEHSINDPEAFFTFFYTNGFYNLGLNIEEVEGIHQESSIFSESLFDKVVSFYSSLFRLYMESDKHMSIREFDRCLDSILRNPETPDITKLITETHQNKPMAIISVDYQGNFSTFSPELIGQPAEQYNNFIFGNVLETGFSDPKGKRLLQNITADINSGIEKCKRECDFFHVCGGGAPANKYFENGTFNSSETKYCKYNIKVPTELVLSFLEEKLSID